MYKKEDLIERSIGILNANPTLSFFDICKELKISRVTAYKYFQDKDDLLQEICKYVLDIKSEFLQKIESQEQTDTEKLKEIIYFFTEKIESYFFLYSYFSLIDSPELEKKYYEQYSRIGKYIERMQKEGMVKKEVSCMWSLYHLDGCIYAAYYAYRDGVFTLSQVQEHVYATFSQSIYS